MIGLVHFCRLDYGSRVVIQIHQVEGISRPDHQRESVKFVECRAVISKPGKSKFHHFFSVKKELSTVAFGSFRTKTELPVKKSSNT